MTDAEQNYEYTKKNVTVPQGYEIAEGSINPDAETLLFWHPLERTWLNFNECYTDFNFPALWAAGSTVIVRQNPALMQAVPPPPVIVPPPAALPPTSFLPPPVVQPQAAPVQEQQPVVVTPPAQTPGLTMPRLSMPSLSAAAPAAPVVQPQPTFAPPAQPIAPPPTQMLPTPEAPVAPSLSLGTTFTASTPAAFTHFERPEDPDAPTSDANMYEVSAWLAAYKGVKDEIKALEAVKDELRTRIVKTCFPKGLREGSNNCALPNGRKLTITGVVNRTLDPAAVPAAAAKLSQVGGDPQAVFVYKLALAEPVYKKLSAEQSLALRDAVTEKSGAPQLEVKEPKAEKK